MQIQIHRELKSASPNLTLGIVTCGVEVSSHDAELWLVIEQRINQIQQQGSLDRVTTLLEIHELRELYRALGKDPSRYRGSAEALIRRIIQGKGLFKVNTVVDINNLVSIETRHSVGSYDVNNLAGAIEFRCGSSGESYQGIGKGSINLEGLPVFVDEVGPFGSPTSDSQRAMITTATRRVAMVIIACSGGDLSAALDRAAALFARHASAVDLETTMIQ